MKGCLITFEGAEGSGKSTQAKLIYEYLRSKKKAVVLFREPGGVKISEAIRNILLDVHNKQITNECETLLYMAARSQLVAEVVLPAVRKGNIVLCDRYLDSTLVYQGFGHGIDMNIIKEMGCFATKGLMPDLTFLFDIDAKEGLDRTGRAKDRIEQRSLAYHNRVRQGYLELARQEPQRIKVIPGNKDRQEIHQIVCQNVENFLKRRKK